MTNFSKGLPHSEAIDVAFKGDRVEFSVRIPVQGRNGERRIVHTGWCVDASHAPWLATCWVTSERA